MGIVIVACSNGELLELPTDVSGMKTGYGRVVNGYFHGLEGFDKYCDGDTVVECEESDPLAMKVADAYQMLHQIWADERAQWDEEIERGESLVDDSDFDIADVIDEWYATQEELEVA